MEEWQNIMPYHDLKALLALLVIVSTLSYIGFDIMKRYKLKKRTSARKFRKSSSRTHKFNLRVRPMRGGTRL